ncbi:F0F1 ATP synthase subunit gamma [Nitrosomonas mobilis]|uniref:ATP synthase gamma chain n=1 Tax=Nitrosomonas mobilis TaxID=51642 RepID=A0A1G5SCT9_9PROT|nr:F0F1 ATP synthase subunit gamma [Nitrosomonas mobilis]SCZ84249.1 F1 sector of membrane-bound ATP synthase, gamma subunit [Nitrosomonas mobilis]HNO76158.1 F0F1 ATP synthase subunit gamma [Nitrosomonas mobilis]
MASSRDIRNKIHSVKNTQKITRAMEMVAASKMRKAQERMKKARPYGEKIRNVAAHMSRASVEYRHPFLLNHENTKKIGVIVVTSDKGLCGGLNTNVLRKALNEIRQWQASGLQTEACCVGNKGLGFMSRLGVNVISQITGLGDSPSMEKLIGAIKVVLDTYAEKKFDKVFIFYNRFINTMKQESVMEQLLPLTDERIRGSEIEKKRAPWDYIYEPEAKPVIDDIMVRYIETIVYQAVAENMASEQSARMVAMKAASDNAGNLIDELTLIYNKTRQAAITKELSEIVGGAAAV